MRLFARYDKNYYFHSTPRNSVKDGLKLIIINRDTKDIEIAERILVAFHKAVEDEKEYAIKRSYTDAWDDNKNVYHKDLLEILFSKNSRRLADYLSNMHRQKATYGITDGASEYKKVSRSLYLRKRKAIWIKDVLVSFGEALGILPYETIVPYVKKNNIYTDSDWLIEEIEKRLDIKISPPEVEGGLFKLSLNNGLFDFRDLWSLYGAWRINNIVATSEAVGEIGGGLGKVAIYAYRFGFRDYSIFDLPVMNAMTAWHLIKAMPDTTIILHGEPNQDGGVRILPYWKFPDKEYGLILNQDSFPEINKEIVENYLQNIKRYSKYFLSINQEHQAPLFPGADNKNLLVPKVIQKVGGFKQIYRFPFWLRKGYVEELYESNQQ